MRFIIMIFTQLDNQIRTDWKPIRITGYLKYDAIIEQMKVAMPKPDVGTCYASLPEGGPSCD